MVRYTYKGQIMKTVAIFVDKISFSGQQGQVRMTMHMETSVLLSSNTYAIAMRLKMKPYVTPKGSLYLDVYSDNLPYMQIFWRLPKYFDAV